MMKRILSAGFLASAVLATAWCAGTAAAAYPERPVTYVIPFAAGGESSITARLQRPVFKTLTGQDLVVQYRPGGGGAVVWSQLNAMPPDGYTIAGVNLPHILLQPALGAQYRAEDIAVVHIFHYTPHAVIVRDDSSIDSLQDLIKLMKDKPGKVAFSGSGRGTANHLAQVWFDKLTGAYSAYRAYKGTSASITALMQEQVDAAWGYTTVGAEYNGQARMLAVAMADRHPQFPDVPTFRELGFDIVGGAYRGIAVPRRTPEEVRTRLSELFGQISQDPEFTARNSALGFVKLDVRYKDIPAFLEAREAEYLPIARDAGLLK